MSSASVKVICRFRPFNEREKKEKVDSDKASIQLDFVEDHTVKVIIPNKPPQSYTFDRVFQGDSLQEDVYNLAARDTIVDVLKGFNGTIFAYGQTGAGKSFSMFGPEISEPRLKGIIPRSCSHIFHHIATDQEGTEYVIKCSFLEIYKEIIRDLLNPKNVNLKVRETPSKGVWVDGLTQVCVTCEQEVLDLLKLGEKYRAVSSTDMNAVSSRSHSLFILQLDQKSKDGSTQSGRLNLADLAGSERVGKTNAKGDTLEEAKKINQSLSALGNCIKALTSGQYVPYRNSKLTFILKESLGGNSKTTLLIACSAHMFNIDETISTLRFGQRAKEIKNKVTVNRQRSVKELETIVTNMTIELSKLTLYSKALEKEIIEKLPKFDITSFRNNHLKSTAPLGQDETDDIKIENDKKKDKKKIEYKDDLSDEDKNDTATITPLNSPTTKDTISKQTSQKTLKIPDPSQLNNDKKPVNKQDYYYDPLALAEAQLQYEKQYEKLKEKMLIKIQDMQEELLVANEKIKKLQGDEDPQAESDDVKFYKEQNRTLSDQIRDLNENISESEKKFGELFLANENYGKEIEKLNIFNGEVIEKVSQLEKSNNELNEEIKNKDKSVQQLQKKLNKLDTELDKEKKNTITLAREIQVEKQLSGTKLLTAEQKIQFLEQKLKFQNIQTSIIHKPEVVVVTATNTTTNTTTNSNTTNSSDTVSSANDMVSEVKSNDTANDKSISLELQSKVIRLEGEVEKLVIDCESKQKKLLSEKENNKELRKELKSYQRKLEQSKLEYDIEKMKIENRIQDFESVIMQDETKRMKLEKEIEDKNNNLKSQEKKIQNLTDQVTKLTSEKHEESKRLQLALNKLEEQQQLIKKFLATEIQSENKEVSTVITPLTSGYYKKSTNTFNFSEFMKTTQQSTGNNTSSSRRMSAPRPGNQTLRRSLTRSTTLNYDPSLDNPIKSPRSSRNDITRSDLSRTDLDSTQKDPDNDVLKEGGLMIQEADESIKGKKYWKRRWFIVKGFELSYFPNSKSDALISKINFKKCTVKRADSMTTKPNSFVIKTDSKNEYFLMADDEEACDNWISFFQNNSR